MWVNINWRQGCEIMSEDTYSNIRQAWAQPALCADVPSWQNKADMGQIFYQPLTLGLD